MTGEHLLRALQPRALSKGGGRKCLDIGRDAACGEAEVFEVGAPPSAFCSWGHQPLATPRPSAACRRTLSARSVKETRSSARARPAQTFCKCNLGIPGEAETQGSREGGGAKRKRRRPRTPGRIPAGRKGLKGSQSGSRGCCQSCGSLQSHPCHFQNLGPTVQLKCGVRSANRWRTEWEQDKQS